MRQENFFIWKCYSIVNKLLYMTYRYQIKNHSLRSNLSYPHCNSSHTMIVIKKEMWCHLKPITLKKIPFSFIVCNMLLWETKIVSPSEKVFNVPWCIAFSLICNAYPEGVVNICHLWKIITITCVYKYLFSVKNKLNNQIKLLSKLHANTALDCVRRLLKVESGFNRQVIILFMI